MLHTLSNKCGAYVFCPPSLPLLGAMSVWVCVCVRARTKFEGLKVECVVALNLEVLRVHFCVSVFGTRTSDFRQDHMVRFLLFGRDVA